jgi:UDP-N-acetylglucosamine 2-epimerase
MGRIDASIFVIGSPDVDMLNNLPNLQTAKPITKYRLRKYGSLFHLAHRGKIQHEPMPIIL